MLVAVLGILAQVQTATPPQRPATVVKDSTPADSAGRRAPIRRAVTAEVRATAFRDAGARDLFDRARRARMAQDSSLASYDATTRQRMSVWGGIGKLGLERLVYRSEGVAHVQWQRNVGAHVEMTGARYAIPVINSTKLEQEALRDVTDDEMSPIPYFPGSETLWAGALPMENQVNERELVNPLAAGAEAYYTYKTGDSVNFRLPDGRTIQLRELELRPREPKANFAVGSLWFDTETGQLVRAAYRLAAPLKGNVSVSGDSTQNVSQKIISAILAGMVSPAEARISAVAIEYGLFGGRFWLPRQQFVEGSMRLSFATMRLKYENSFTYATVNGPLALARIEVDTTREALRRQRRHPPPELDSIGRRKWRDSVRALEHAEYLARQDSVKRKLRVGTWQQCDTSATRIVTEYRYEEARVPVQVRVPCDLNLLTQSKDFENSIYDPEDEVFGVSDRERLVGEALSLLAQAPLLSAFPMPSFQYGFSMTRYNRVEGFSTGLRIDQQIGGGYSIGALGRIGFADKIPDWEVSLARSNASKTITLNGYRRLVAVNDWGNPLSFGSGLSALLFGRDEGFYYRARGAELLWTSERGPRLDWRAFAERRFTAVPKATRTVGGRFGPNIDSVAGEYLGGGVRFVNTLGENPRGLRMFTDLRLEGAGAGVGSYGRGALDLTFTREFGKFAAALTTAGGSSVGDLPVERHWYLGGTQTVRGQRPDIAISGDAFWLGRLELARPVPGVRFALFGDIGWTGDREKVDVVGRPLSGAGVGVSGLDGLIRLDVARGIYPEKKVRVNLYLDARF